MKESGIDWIGQIPEEWEVIKFKYLGDVKQGLTYSPSDIVDKDEGILVLRSGNIQNGVLDFTNNVYVKTKVAESIVLRKNDILITARNGSSALIGKNAIIDTDIKATFGAFMMVFRTNKSLIAKFAFYLMNISFNFYRTFFTTSTVNQLTATIFNGIEVPLPSISEQQKIADFLDKKTAQLDKVKSLLEEQIQKLKDYRASLIYETVTKGLDKTVPLKDSGIDWIGEVPQGWGVIKFKYLGDVKQGLTYSPSDIVDKDEGILVLRSGNIQNGILDFNNNVYVKTKVAESIVLRKNDILITARNGSPVLIGKNAIIDTDIKATFGAFMMVFRANKSLFAKFAFYLMNVSFNFYRTFFTTSTVNQLTAAIFNGIEVPLPSIYEQKKITDFLDQKTVQIDKLIQIKNQQIENINKQRQTLIYDYVTGKRRV